MIVLTGALGFIGQNFLKYYFDQKLKKNDVILLDLDNCYTFLNHFEDWDNIDLIIHQGAMTSTTEKSIAKLYHYNVAFTFQLFEKAKEYDIPIKYASSASIYGNTNGEINPLNQYAISKLQIDYYVQDNLNKFYSIQGFRYFNVYGNGEDKKGDQASPVSKFRKQIKETGKLKLFEGSDKFYRDFICVNDIVNIVLNNDAPNGIYDLGTGSAISFQDVAEKIIKHEGGEIEYIPFPEKLKGHYQTHTCADMSWLDDYKFTTIEEYLHTN